MDTGLILPIYILRLSLYTLHVYISQDVQVTGSNLHNIMVSV